MMPKQLYAHILLDRSGSMESCRAATVSGVNEYLNGLRAQKDETVKRVTLTTFDNISIDDVWVNIDPSVAHLNEDQFVPRSMTPLNDAIGKTINRIDAMNLANDHLVALVILTDGLENASVEFTNEGIKKKLEARQKEKNWLVIYLGANQDAFAEGGMRGTRSANTMSFDVRNVAQTMSMAAASTQLYTASGDNEKVAFTDDDRKRAMNQE